MSEEEKKAIEQIKYQIYDSDGNRVSYIDISDAWIDECSKFISAIEIVLSLIDKQQKEIEEKTTILLAGAEKVKQLEKEIEELKKPKYLVHFENNKITKMELINDYISKDKIRDYFAQALAFKRRLIREKEEISDYNRGKFDTIEDLFERLKDNKWN